MTTNSLEELWEILSKENGLSTPRRLHSKKNNVRISATFRNPEKYYGIAFSFHTNKAFDLKKLSQLEELQILLIKDNAYDNSQLLVVELVNSDNLNVFKALCNDLIRQIERIEDADEAFRVIVNQLQRWNNLFRKSRNKEGLDQNKQLGLYAELTFLKKLLTKTSLKPERIVNTWVGPEAAVRDFEYEAGAVEVKSTIANQPLTSIINGERQLDETHLDSLFVFHLLVERKKGEEQTLSQLIKSIREILSLNMTILELFDLKLFKVGYYTEQESLYDDTTYDIRKETFYKVEGEFPRIKESDLKVGIGNVKYILDLSSCDNYKVEENFVLNNLISLWEN